MACQRVDPHASEALCGYTSFQQYVIMKYGWLKGKLILKDCLAQKKKVLQNQRTIKERIDPK